MPGRPRPHGHQDAAGRQYLSVGDLPIGQVAKRAGVGVQTVRYYERRGRRRLPIELLVIGAACLVCCLPLLGGVLAAASGVLAGVGTTSPGAGPGLAVAIAAVAGAVAASIGWWVRRRAPQCTTCGGTRCAC